MKSYSFVFVLLVAIAITASPANPEAPGTDLVMAANWDNGHPIQGTVSLVQANSGSSNSAIAAKPLSRGQASVIVPLAGNAVYNVTLVESNGTQLLKFPFMTGLINPSNLRSARIEIVLRVADNSVASARINVLMNF